MLIVISLLSEEVLLNQAIFLHCRNNSAMITIQKGYM
jgi:hypothetical protein